MRRLEIQFWGGMSQTTLAFNPWSTHVAICKPKPPKCKHSSKAGIGYLVVSRIEPLNALSIIRQVSWYHRESLTNHAPAHPHVVCRSRRHQWFQTSVVGRAQHQQEIDEYPDTRTPSQQMGLCDNWVLQNPLVNRPFPDLKSHLDPFRRYTLSSDRPKWGLPVLRTLVVLEMPLALGNKMPPGSLLHGAFSRGAGWLWCKKFLFCSHFKQMDRLNWTYFYLPSW